MNAHAVKRVDVVGGIAADTVLEVDHMPNQGEQVQALSFTESLGGRGANQAVAVSRSGVDVRLIGSVGADEAGRMALEQLAAYGVDTELIGVHEGATTGHGYLVTDPEGQIRTVNVRGANELTNVDLVHDAADLLANSAVVIAQSEIGAAALAEMITLSQNWAGRLVVSMAPAVELSDDLLASIDVLVTNEASAAALCGRQMTRKLEDTEDNAVELASRGKSVVVSRGADGAVVVPSRRPVEFLMASYTEVIDPTGAGDAFVGVLAAGLARGLGVQESTAAAVRQATRTVSRRGGVSSYPMFTFH